MSDIRLIKGFISDRSVYINDERLHPFKSQRLRNHSPDGFNWGYTGSGPAQMALALLLQIAGERFALEHYHKFKFEVIAGLAQGQDFILDEKLVLAWIQREIDHEKKGG